MRFIRPAIVVALLLSVALNGVLYQKQASRRTALLVNDRLFTKRDYDNALEARFGAQAMAVLARQELVRQATARAGISASQAEVDAKVKDLRERVPDTAVLFDNEPVKEEDARNEVRYGIEMAALRSRDVQATEAEVRAHFAANPGKWDPPDRIYLKVMQTSDAALAERAVEFMKQISDMRVLQQQLDPRGISARAVGADGTMVIITPPDRRSTDPMAAQIAAMADGDARIIAVGNSLMVIKRIRRERGKVLSFDAARPLVERDFKLTRALPEAEVLRKLWDAAKVESDDPNMKRQLKWVLFRDNGGK